MNRSSLFLRHKRWVLIAGILGVVGISWIVFKLVRREEPLPTMAEVMAADATETANIVVGPNVQVSTANAANSHRSFAPRLNSSRSMSWSSIRPVSVFTV